MRHLIFVALLAGLISAPVNAAARKSSARPTHRAAVTARKNDRRPKTSNVHGYTRKNGKRVAPY